jgi:hypothetical protein
MVSEQSLANFRWINPDNVFTKPHQLWVHLMRQLSAFALTFTLVAIAGCGKGIDVKRDIVFDLKNPVVVWFEPVSSELKVHPFYRSTGFLVDFFLIQADSEAKAQQLVDQQLPPEGFSVGWRFKPDSAITLGKVLDQENDGFDATIPAGKGFAAVLYPVTRMPAEYDGKFKGFVWIAND